MADTAEFAAGLLDPQQPVPLLVKGQIERRYAVYRNNVTVGLIRVLEANFPVVRRLLGGEYFAGFARDFAQSHPPQSPLMFQYGQAFSAVLERDNDLAQYPYLADIARLEIFWRESYHAADATPLAGDVLSSIDPEQLFECRFIVHPSTCLLQSPYAIHDIYVANRLGQDEPVRDIQTPQSVLLTRPHHDVVIHAISAQQFAFLSALKNGKSLSQALEDEDLDEDFDLTDALTLMLQSGAFQNIQHSKGIK